MAVTNGSMLESVVIRYKRVTAVDPHDSETTFEVEYHYIVRNRVWVFYVPATPALILYLYRRVQAGTLEMTDSAPHFHGESAWSYTADSDVYHVYTELSPLDLPYCRKCGELMTHPDDQRAGVCLSCLDTAYNLDMMIAHSDLVDELPDDEAEYYRGLLE